MKSVDHLIEEFIDTYSLGKIHREHIKSLVDIEIPDAESGRLSATQIINILVNEIEFTLENFKKCSTLAIYYNDLLNKDKARHIKDILFTISQFLLFVMQDKESSLREEINQDTNKKILSTIEQIDDAILRFSKYLFEY